MENEKKIVLNVIHWNITKREPKYVVLSPGTVDGWAKRISEQAQKGAAFGKDCGKMCSDCAFKYEQPHDTSYLESVDGAVLMLMQEGKFHCHSDKHEDSGTPCAGFLYAQEYLKHQN